jgi:hypothetical protein
MLAISLFRLIIDRSVYSGKFLVDFILIIFIWRLIKSFLIGSLSKLGQEIFATEINVNRLKPGMILSEAIQKKENLAKKELEWLKKQPNTSLIRHKGNYYIIKPKTHMEFDNFLEEEAEGVTKEQINKIKIIGIKRIRISHTIPFAPLIFLGILLTIIAKGNILIMIKSLF